MSWSRSRVDETHKSCDLVPATAAAGQGLLLLRTQRLTGGDAGEVVRVLERTSFSLCLFPTV